jgi:hypothetical protein
MSIEVAYKEKLVEEIVRDFLEDGVLPTPDQIEEEFLVRVGVGKNLSRPLSIDGSFTVSENDSSSASKYNNFLARVQSDLEVVYTEG